MITRLKPIEFIRNTRSGRTHPALLTCESSDGDEVEVVAKFSAGCDEGITNLAREVIAACLAADLGLPIPQPYLLEISPEWAAVVVEPGQRARIQRSSPIAFGSKLLGSQYSAWSSGSRLLDDMVQVAAAILTFDAIIQNADRRLENPNCLIRGDQLRIIDHELTFMHRLIIGWKPPWELGGLSVMQTPGYHIFQEGLRGRSIDYVAIRDSWACLSNEQILSYCAALPSEWAASSLALQSSLQLIEHARDNIDGCIAEVRRILS